MKLTETNCPLVFEAILHDSTLNTSNYATTSQAGIRTHILTTPELESNVLDSSAMTLHKVLNMKMHGAF